MASERKNNKKYIPGVSSFFVDSNKSLEEIIASPGIHQEEIFFDNNDVFDKIKEKEMINNRDKDECEADKIEKIIRAVLSNLRVFAVSGNVIKLYLRNTHMCTLFMDRDTTFNRNNNNGNHSVQLFADISSIQAEIIDKSDCTLVEMLFDFSSGKYIKDIFVNVFAEIHKDNVKIVKIGLVKDVNKKGFLL